MFNKFKATRILELICVQVTFSIGLFIFLSLIDSTLLSLNANFTFESIVQPILSLPWNGKAQIVTPAIIVFMVISLFLKNIFFRITTMSIAVVAWLLVGATVVVTTT